MFLKSSLLLCFIVIAMTMIFVASSSFTTASSLLKSAAVSSSSSSSSSSVRWNISLSNSNASSRNGNNDIIGIADSNSSSATVFATTSTHLFAISKQTGTILWKVKPTVKSASESKSEDAETPVTILSAPFYYAPLRAVVFSVGFLRASDKKNVTRVMIISTDSGHDRLWNQDIAWQSEFVITFTPKIVSSGRDDNIFHLIVAARGAAAVWNYKIHVRAGPTARYFFVTLTWTWGKTASPIVVAPGGGLATMEPVATRNYLFVSTGAMQHPLTAFAMQAEERKEIWHKCPGVDGCQGSGIVLNCAVEEEEEEEKREGINLRDNAIVCNVVSMGSGTFIWKLSAATGKELFAARPKPYYGSELVVRDSRVLTGLEVFNVKDNKGWFGIESLSYRDGKAVWNSSLLVKERGITMPGLTYSNTMMMPSGAFIAVAFARRSDASEKKIDNKIFILDPSSGKTVSAVSLPQPAISTGIVTGGGAGGGGDTRDVIVGTRGGFVFCVKF